MQKAGGSGKKLKGGDGAASSSSSPAGANNDFSGLDEAVVNLLECPVCLEVVRAGVSAFSCENGHLVCGPCRGRIPAGTCPTCRNGRLFRIKFAERLAKETFAIVRIWAKCKFAHHGCGVEMPMAELASHEWCCIFREQACIGKYEYFWALDKCGWTGPQHLLPYHKDQSDCFYYGPCIKTDRNTYSYECNIAQDTTNGTAVGRWKPCLLGHSGGDLTRFQIYACVSYGRGRVWDVHATALCPAAVAEDIVVSIVASRVEDYFCDDDTDEDEVPPKFSYSGGVCGTVGEDGAIIYKRENALRVHEDHFSRLYSGKTKFKYRITVTVPEWAPDDAGCN